LVGFGPFGEYCHSPFTAREPGIPDTRTIRHPPSWPRSPCHRIPGSLFYLDHSGGAGSWTGWWTGQWTGQWTGREQGWTGRFSL